MRKKLVKGLHHAFRVCDVRNERWQEMFLHTQLLWWSLYWSVFTPCRIRTVVYLRLITSGSRIHQFRLLFNGGLWRTIGTDGVNHVIQIRFMKNFQNFYLNCQNKILGINALSQLYASWSLISEESFIENSWLNRYSQVSFPKVSARKKSLTPYTCYFLVMTCKQ